MIKSTFTFEAIKSLQGLNPLNNEKRFMVFFALLGVIQNSAQSNEIEINAITTTLNYYLVGGTNNDFETLKKAFHVNATMKFIGAEYKEVNALIFFKNGMKPGPKQDRKTRITSINLEGNAANAKLEIEYRTFYFYDYMNLLRIDGEWKIVGKIFYKKMKD